MTRAAVLTISQRLISEECCECGMVFAMPEEFRDRCLEKKQDKSFYCPNGHRQWYVGKTDAELRDEAERALAVTRAALDQAHATAAEERKKAQAAARKARQMQQRAEATACPAGCTRTFQPQGMKRHLSTKHPDYHPA